MGNITGALGKAVIKKARRFNVENRTDKFLERNVKVVAPKPLATQKEIEKLHEENPGLMSELSKRNPELIDRLRNVYVTSFDKTSVESNPQNNPNRPLPVSRKYEPEDFGYVEPDSIPPGFVSLRQALRLISQYQADKNNETPEKLASQYNLKTEDVGNIIENFKLFTVYESNKGLNSTFDVPAIEPTEDNSIAYYERFKAKVDYREKQEKLKDSEKDQKKNSLDEK
ncbi:Protein NDUFAF4-like protein [Frankliniella fusca]|uniref:Protein NDUFAF4-like protein n=1 Tax=Frankliniella fusca TaxID=407009 RepID=A0AAE1HMP9_9NEOP|nr:Protein NDUFAF4-like protein [Frankliniella fusca]